MYRRLSQGNKNIADQFGRWVYQNGIVLKGLVRRRA
jgi:GH24 family phage-related lysozyme (muramidase)